MTKSKPKNLESPPRATYQDLLDVPSHLSTELIDGELYTHSRPLTSHTKTHSRLMGLINFHFDFDDYGPDGWLIRLEPEIHLGENVVIPDIAGWRRERMHLIQETDLLAQTPDWVCEVLFDSTRTTDLGRKKKLYAQEGVVYLWYADPDARWLEAHWLRGDKWEFIERLHDDASVSQRCAYGRTTGKLSEKSMSTEIEATK